MNPGSDWNTMHQFSVNGIYRVTSGKGNELTFKLGQEFLINLVKLRVQMEHGARFVQSLKVVKQFFRDTFQN